MQVSRRQRADPLRAAATAARAASYAVEALERRVLLAVTPAGVEFRANVATANDQRAPAIAADGDGDFVVAWTSTGQDGSDDGVYARRFDAAGAARQVPGAAADVTEFRVNTFTTGNQSGPAVAVDADGDFVVAWTSAGRDGSDYGVYAQRYDAAGIARGGEFRVNTFTAGSQSGPTVAMDADGDFVVAWVSFGQDGGGSGIYAQRYDAAGAPRATSSASTPSRPATSRGRRSRWTPTATSSSPGTAAATASSPGGTTPPARTRAASSSSTRSRSAPASPRPSPWTPAGTSSSPGPATRTATTASTPSGTTPPGRPRASSSPSTHSRATSRRCPPSPWTRAATSSSPGPAPARTATAPASTPSDTTRPARHWPARPAPAGDGANEFRANTATANGQQLPAVAMDADGDFVVAWESLGQDGSSPASYGVYAQRYNEDTDAAGPVVASVTAAGKRLTPGIRLRSTFGEAVVTFSENLNTTGGAGGVNSATNPANWVLTRDGQPVPSGIASVAFALNATTGKYTATLTFSAALAAGDYVLTARSAIRDLTGNALDGDFDGAPGGDYALAFSVRPTAAVAPEFRANTVTAENQLNPAVAMDADGDYVVVWQSYAQDGGRYGVYAQRYDAAGTKRGIEFRVNTVTAGVQAEPAVAMDADGDFIVVWTSYTQDPGGSAGVYAQRYNAAGTEQGIAFRVNMTTAGAQRSAAVAMDADGDFVVAWQSYGQDGGGSGVYAQRYDAAGTARQVPGAAAGVTEFRVNTFTAGDQGGPAVAMDADGDFVVAWQSFLQDGSGFGVYAQRYDAAGSARQVPGAAAGVTEFRVNTTTTENQLRPAVAMDAGGDFVVAWGRFGQDGSSYGVYAQRYDAAGTARQAPGAAAGVTEFRVNTFATGDQAIPAVAMDAGGDFVVAWQSFLQDGSDYGVYAQRYDAAGAAQGGEFRVNTVTADKQFAAAVAMDAGGDFVVAWTSQVQDGSSYGVYAQRYAVPVAAPAVQVNDGTAQRSKVTELTVTFARAVTLDTGAITLAGRNGAGTGMTVTTANPLGDGRTWRLTFSGGPIIGSSLADGVYDLTVAATKVHDPAGGLASGLPADFAFEFHRLYSDADGDGDSDNADLFQFRGSYNKPSNDPGFRSYFDYDSDGDVDNADLFQVRGRRTIEFKGY